MAKSKTILIRAVNGDEKSDPIKIYSTNEEVEFPKQFVLRMDNVTNDDGEERLRISNYSLGLINSHEVDYLTGKVEGFRRDKDDMTFLIVERVKDDIPKLSAISKIETY